MPDCIALRSLLLLFPGPTGRYARDVPSTIMVHHLCTQTPAGVAHVFILCLLFLFLFFFFFCFKFCSELLV